MVALKHSLPPNRYSLVLRCHSIATRQLLIATITVISGFDTIKGG